MLLGNNIAMQMLYFIEGCSVARTLIAPGSTLFCNSALTSKRSDFRFAESVCQKYAAILCSCLSY